MRPFRFGIQASAAPTAKAWKDLARKVEDLGYDLLTMPDHFTDQLAPVPALMAAADATTTLRVGAAVWDNDYKHPVVLGKELATMDVLSDGRLEIGLGAGWMRSDYDAAGIPFDANGVRVSRFEEAITVMKGLFRDGASSFAGQHYTITNYDGLPKSVQKPWPPLFIGGGGKRVLSIAGREADIVGINGTLTHGAIDATTFASMSAAAVDEKLGWVKTAAGTRFAAIELNVRTFLVKVCNDRNEEAAKLAAFIGFSPDDLLASPFALIGTTEQITQDLLERRERWGFSCILLGAPEIDLMAPVVAALAGK
jgi:probable F420-dependent oxidoreductase